MYKVDLVKSVFLNTQLKEIQRNTSFTYKEIFYLHRCLRFLHVMEDTGAFKCEIIDFKALKDITLKQYVPDCEDAELPGYYYGSDALIVLCRLQNIDVSPISHISIPVIIFYEAGRTIWDDLSYFVAMIEEENAEYKQLLESSLPNIILFNKEKRLIDWVECLEHNDFSDIPTHFVLLKGNSYKDNNGRVLRSLNDIGCSLINGWDSEMKQVWEKRNEQTEI